MLTLSYAMHHIKLYLSYIFTANNAYPLICLMHHITLNQPIIYFCFIVDLLKKRNSSVSSLIKEPPYMKFM